MKRQALLLLLAPALLLLLQVSGGAGSRRCPPQLKWLKDTCAKRQNCTPSWDMDMRMVKNLCRILMLSSCDKDTLSALAEGKMPYDDGDSSGAKKASDRSGVSKQNDTTCQPCVCHCPISNSTQNASKNSTNVSRGPGTASATTSVQATQQKDGQRLSMKQNEKKSTYSNVKPTQSKQNTISKGKQSASMNVSGTNNTSNASNRKGNATIIANNRTNSDFDQYKVVCGPDGFIKINVKYNNSNPSCGCTIPLKICCKNTTIKGKQQCSNYCFKLLVKLCPSSNKMSKVRSCNATCIYYNSTSTVSKKNVTQATIQTKVQSSAMVNNTQGGLRAKPVNPAMCVQGKGVPQARRVMASGGGGEGRLKNGQGSGEASGECFRECSGEGSEECSEEGAFTGGDSREGFGVNSRVGSGVDSRVGSGEGSAISSGEGSGECSGEGFGVNSRVGSVEGSIEGSGEGSGISSGEASGECSGVSDGGAEVVVQRGSKGQRFKKRKPFRYDDYRDFCPYYVNMANAYNPFEKMRMSDLAKNDTDRQCYCAYERPLVLSEMPCD